jgi:hypothetical protein
VAADKKLADTLDKEELAMFTVSGVDPDDVVHAVVGTEPQPPKLVAKESGA